MRLKRDQSHRRSFKTKKSPRKHVSEKRSKEKTHFDDEGRSKKAVDVGRNLTESLVEDKDKVAHKEVIGKKGVRRRRAKGKKEEELLKCLELIEMAKDKLLLNDEDGDDDRKERDEGESTNVSASLSR